MSRVLLLGGTGFIGRAAYRELVARGHQVTTVARSPLADVRLDVTDLAAVQGALMAADVDVVVNLLGAGLAAGTVDLATMTVVNAELPGLVLRTLIDRGLPVSLVHAASSTERRSEDEAHESEYSRTKHLGAVSLREVAQGGSIPVTMLRIHNSYGPGQPSNRFVASMVQTLRAGRPATLHFPDRVRDFVYIDDVAACIAHALTMTSPGVTDADIGTGTGTSLREVAVRIAALLGRSADLVQGAVPRLDDPHPSAICSVPRGTFGLCTTTLDEGLRRMVEDA